MKTIFYALKNIFRVSLNLFLKRLPYLKHLIWHLICYYFKKSICLCQKWIAQISPQLQAAVLSKSKGIIDFLMIWSQLSLNILYLNRNINVFWSVSIWIQGYQMPLKFFFLREKGPLLIEGPVALSCPYGAKPMLWYAIPAQLSSPWQMCQCYWWES